jgi:hypothetical protein
MLQPCSPCHLHVWGDVQVCVVLWIVRTGQACSSASTCSRVSSRSSTNMPQHGSAELISNCCCLHAATAWRPMAEHGSTHSTLATSARPLPHYLRCWQQRRCLLRQPPLVRQGCWVLRCRGRPWLQRPGGWGWGCPWCPAMPQAGRGRSLRHVQEGCGMPRREQGDTSSAAGAKQADCAHAGQRQLQAG